MVDTHVHQQEQEDQTFPSLPLILNIETNAGLDRCYIDGESQTLLSLKILHSIQIHVLLENKQP